jgi:hypothetical protein
VIGFARVCVYARVCSQNDYKADDFIGAYDASSEVLVSSRALSYVKVDRHAADNVPVRERLCCTSVETDDLARGDRCKWCRLCRRSSFVCGRCGASCGSA